MQPIINVEYKDNATVVTFAKEKILEDKDIQQIQDSLISLVEQAGRINLILNFCKVRFFSSAVLGLLIRVSKKIYEQDGQLRLCNISPNIFEIFKITRLNKIFDIYEDIDDAAEGVVPD